MLALSSNKMINFKAHSFIQQILTVLLWWAYKSAEYLVDPALGYDLVDPALGYDILVEEKNSKHAVS